jgi:outer membrane protein OmpA-like peptidoglycan-associated protein
MPASREVRRLRDRRYNGLRDAVRPGCNRGMRRVLLLALPLIAVLAGCGTRPAPAPPVAPVPAPAPAPPARATLVTEQLRLAELFRGTPVVFSLQQDGSLRATVPRRFSFDAGAVQVKPPLAAVLDRLAKSQRAATSRLRVTAPSDPDSRNPALARDRAASVRDHFVAQGIAAARVQVNGAPQTEIVEIVVSEGSR